MASKQMTDEELRVVVENHSRNAVGYQSSKLSEQRRKALAYYLARPVGDLSPPEIEGRSTVVATDVADTVEWILPQLVKTFCSSDNVVEFKGRKPQDEQQAAQATEYCNYIFYQQNPGFAIFNTWTKDGLIQKNGFLKVWWDKSSEKKREDYEGLDEMQVTMLLTDPDNEPKKILEQKAYPDPGAVQQQKLQVAQLQQQLHSILDPTAFQSKAQGIMAQAQQAASQPAPPQQPPQPGQPPQPPAPDPMQAAQQQIAQLQQQQQQAAQQIQLQIQQVQQQTLPMLYDIALENVEDTSHVCIENVPPEEFLISRDDKSLRDCTFVAHRVRRTISDLKAAGYKNVDDIKSDDDPGVYSSERLERISTDDDMGMMMSAESDPADPSMRQVWLLEAYVKVDANGDGIAEWRKVTVAGDRLLDNEECDGHPFISWTPVPLPHRFFGTCPAEQAMQTQRIATSIWRGALDNLYLGINGRYWAVDNQVNLDDLLTVRPGGVVRVQSPQAVGRLDGGMGDSAGAMNMLEYLDQVKQNRTGFTRNTNGTDGDALNKQTAHAAQIADNRDNMRIEYISRIFAETGVTDLFRRILKLVTCYQDKPATVKLTGGWVDIDPREWRNGFDISINVGLGTGNKDQLIHHLTNLMQIQGQGLQFGIATPQNLFNTAKQLPPALGFKAAEEYFTDPTQNPQQQQKPDPEMMKVQGQLQIDQQKQKDAIQVQQAQFEADQAMEQQRMQHDAAKSAQEAQLEQQRMQHDAMLRQMEIESRERLEMAKARLASETSIIVAQIGAKQQADAAELAANATYLETINGRAD